MTGHLPQSLLFSGSPHTTADSSSLPGLGARYNGNTGSISISSSATEQSSNGSPLPTSRDHVQPTHHQSMFGGHWRTPPSNHHTADLSLEDIDTESSNGSFDSEDSFANNTHTMNGNRSRDTSFSTVVNATEVITETTSSLDSGTPKTPRGDSVPEMHSSRTVLTGDVENNFTNGGVYSSIRKVDEPSAHRLAKRLFYLDGFKRSDVAFHLTRE